jgi:microcystin-dependent protein
LFSLIGVTFGAGNGTTTFNIPDMQQRYPRQDSAALGATGGDDTHSHQIDGGTPAAAAEIVITNGSIINLFENEVNTSSWAANWSLNASSPSSTATATESKGAKVVGQTQATNNDPPYLNLNFIIKT